MRGITEGAAHRDVKYATDYLGQTGQRLLRMTKVEDELVLSPCPPRKTLENSNLAPFLYYRSLEGRS
jgi:hypothetical protein